MMSQSIRRIIILGLMAFLIYGSWAAYANSAYGWSIALRSGVLQGLLSLLVTMLMTFIMEWIFVKINLWGLRFICTAFGPLSVLLSLMALAHWLAGTPNILATIAPSIMVGTLYCVLYTLRLSKVQVKTGVRIFFYAVILILTLLLGFIVLR